MADYRKLKAAAQDAIDKEPGSPVHFLALQRLAKLADPTSVLELIAEAGRLETQFKEWQASHHSNYCVVADERDELKAEVEALRGVMADCTDSLHAEMLCKFGGQRPDDMHPVTRREYDRDMSEVAGYRAAMSKESGHD